jgi:hypothetical protein
MFARCGFHAGRYVAAGEWPSSGDDDATPTGTSGRVSIPKRLRKSALQRPDGHFPRSLAEVAPPAPCCYKAQITGVRASRAGRTLTVLFIWAPGMGGVVPYPLVSLAWL